MQNNFPVEIRWSDLDPNFHLRHSVYYDWCATVRVNALYAAGMTIQFMQQNHFGPIIFREEAVFKKEVHFGDAMSIRFYLLNCRRDYSRWSVLHEIVKADGTVSALVTVDGAFLDTKIRKLTVPPVETADIFSHFERHADFKWLD
jgi:acyl-CoA thioester hydrolase